MNDVDSSHRWITLNACSGHEWHGSFIVWHDSLMCATWFFYMWRDVTHTYEWMSHLVSGRMAHVWCDSFIWVPRLMYMRAMNCVHICVVTRSYVCVCDTGSRLRVRADSTCVTCCGRPDGTFIHVTWPIHTHSNMWHDSFICVTWLIQMCDMTHPYVQRNLFIRVWHDSWNATWLIPTSVLDKFTVVCVWHTQEATCQDACEWVSHVSGCTWRSELFSVMHSFIYSVSRIHISFIRLEWLILCHFIQCRAYKGVSHSMSLIWMNEWLIQCHFIQCHAYEGVSHSMSLIWMNEWLIQCHFIQCHAYEGVSCSVSLIWTNESLESCHSWVWLVHVIHSFICVCVNESFESCHSYEGVLQCDSYERAIHSYICGIIQSSRVVSIIYDFIRAMYI